MDYVPDTALNALDLGLRINLWGAGAFTGTSLGRSIPGLMKSMLAQGHLATETQSPVWFQSPCPQPLAISLLRVLTGMDRGLLARKWHKGERRPHEQRQEGGNELGVCAWGWRLIWLGREPMWVFFWEVKLGSKEVGDGQIRHAWFAGSKELCQVPGCGREGSAVESLV